VDDSRRVLPAGQGRRQRADRRIPWFSFPCARAHSALVAGLPSGEPIHASATSIGRDHVLAGRSVDRHDAGNSADPAPDANRSGTAVRADGRALAPGPACRRQVIARGDTTPTSTPAPAAISRASPGSAAPLATAVSAVSAANGVAPTR